MIRSCNRRPLSHLADRLQHWCSRGWHHVESDHFEGLMWTPPLRIVPYAMSGGQWGITLKLVNHFMRCSTCWKFQQYSLCLHILLVITSREKLAGTSKSRSFVANDSCPNIFQVYFLIESVVVGGLYLVRPPSRSMAIFPVSQSGLTHSNVCVQSVLNLRNLLLSNKLAKHANLIYILKFHQVLLSAAGFQQPTYQRTKLMLQNLALSNWSSMINWLWNKKNSDSNQTKDLSTVYGQVIKLRHKKLIKICFNVYCCLIQCATWAVTIRIGLWI